MHADDVGAVVFVVRAEAAPDIGGDFLVVTRSGLLARGEVLELHPGRWHVDTSRRAPRGPGSRRDNPPWRGPQAASVTPVPPFKARGGTSCGAWCPAPSKGAGSARPPARCWAPRPSRPRSRSPWRCAGSAPQRVDGGRRACRRPPSSALSWWAGSLRLPLTSNRSTAVDTRSDGTAPFHLGHLEHLEHLGRVRTSRTTPCRSSSANLEQPASSASVATRASALPGTRSTTALEGVGRTVARRPRRVAIGFTQCRPFTLRRSTDDHVDALLATPRACCCATLWVADANRLRSPARSLAAFDKSVKCMVRLRDRRRQHSSRAARGRWCWVSRRAGSRVWLVVGTWGAAALA